MLVTWIYHLLKMYRLRTSNILLINIKALANEIAKNLVLAGIGSLTIIDNEVVRDDDLGSQFFVSEEQIGFNVLVLGLRSFISFADTSTSEQRPRHLRSESSTRESHYTWTQRMCCEKHLNSSRLSTLSSQQT